jgi:hypothetical protein
MLKHTRTAILSILAASSLLSDVTLAATADSKLPTRRALVSPTNFIGWIAVTPLQATSRSGPLAKMSDGASNSRRRVG